MGRPGTPGPSDGGGSSSSAENKATFSATVVLLAVLSFVLGAVAVAVPRWGNFRPPGAGNYNNYNPNYAGGSLEGTGYFGPFFKCIRTNGGWNVHCGDNAGQFEIYVYMKIGGVLAVVATASTGLFCIFAGLHCMMQINNKKICIGYQKNTLLAFITAIVADISTIGAVAISAPQFSDRSQRYTAQLGPCFYIEICLILFNLLLVVLSYVSYKKASKSNFPIQRNAPYVITGDHYGNENFAGPQHSANRGIAVTSTSGVHYSHQQPPPGPATFQPTQLPPYPAPSNGYPVYPQANGHVNNGYQQQQQQLGQVAQPQAQRAYVPQRDPMGVSDNPMGRGVRMAPGAVNGSVDTLNTTDGDNTSMLSFGSTGSYSSAASINNPMRSSLKKPKNKETASVASAASKKSVRIALGEEQTAV